jgi:hypothetical protein
MKSSISRMTAIPARSSAPKMPRELLNMMPFSIIVRFGENGRTWAESKIVGPFPQWTAASKFP